jgi:hypothetical protein
VEVQRHGLGTGISYSRTKSHGATYHVMLQQVTVIDYLKVLLDAPRTSQESGILLVGSRVSGLPKVLTRG